jgi:Ni/Co efflux regulator RcnB
MKKLLTVLFVAAVGAALSMPAVAQDHDRAQDHKQAKRHHHRHRKHHKQARKEEKQEHKG